MSCFFFGRAVWMGSVFIYVSIVVIRKQHVSTFFELERAGRVRTFFHNIVPPTQNVTNGNCDRAGGDHRQHVIGHSP